jgi:CDP-diacylglycerol--serine O-phosphatidyltransferase
VVMVIAALFIAQAKGLFAIALLYALSGPVYWAWTRLHRKPAA